MDDESIKDLLAQAMLGSACAEASCRVSAEPHHWYLWLVHLDDDPWDSAAYPRRLLAYSTVAQTERRELVKAISLWLTHLHEAPARRMQQSGAAGSDGLLDADPVACAAA